MILMIVISSCILALTKLLVRLDGPVLEPVYFDHLSGIEGDPALSLLASLKNNLGEHGTVIAWHASFESARNREMGGLHPQYAGFMEGVNDRIYDLKEIVSKGIYQHPGFKGSNSIKNVLPVMVPELSYTDLEINNGSQASFGWWQLAFSNLDKVEREMLMVQMLAYCRLDTLAMVEIYRRFAAFAARE